MGHQPPASASESGRLHAVLGRAFWSRHPTAPVPCVAVAESSAARVNEIHRRVFDFRIRLRVSQVLRQTTLEFSVGFGSSRVGAQVMPEQEWIPFIGSPLHGAHGYWRGADRRAGRTSTFPDRCLAQPYPVGGDRARHLRAGCNRGA